MRNLPLSLLFVSTLSASASGAAQPDAEQAFAEASAGGREFAENFCSRLPANYGEVFNMQVCDDLNARKQNVIYTSLALIAAGPLAFGGFWLYRRRKTIAPM